MSTDAKAIAGAPGAAKKKGKLPLIIGAALAVAAAAGGGLWWQQSHAVPADKPATAAAPSRLAPIYYKFDPAFVVNFGGEGNVRYLQITLEAMSRDAAVIEEIKNNEPAIRNDLVLLFSAQQYDALLAPEGKETLRQAALEAVRKTVAAESGKADAIEGVYFTSFVIQ
jgi:flagellar FliL protein